jgi:hypothetical protein
MIVCPLGVRGQKDNGTHYLNISEFSKNLEMSDPNFKIKEVINKTEEGDNFGFIQTGFFNNYRKVVFQNGLSYDMTKYINRRYYENPYGTPITMEVHKLSISERSVFAEKGRVIVHIQYFHNGEMILLYNQVRNHKTFGDITKRNIKTLDEMVSSSLEELSLALKKR